MSLSLTLKREIVTKFMQEQDCVSIGQSIEARGHQLRFHSPHVCIHDIHRDHVAHAVEEVLRDYINGKFKLAKGKKCQ